MTEPLPTDPLPQPPTAMPYPEGLQAPAPPGAPINYSAPSTSDSDLNTLSICWYVLSALVAMVSVLPFAYFGCGTLMTLMSLTSRETAPGSVMGIIVMLIAGLAMLAILGVAFLFFTCGRSLKQRRRMTLCQVAAAIACLNIPLGLILAIFTFMVLARPDVKASFR